MRDPQSITKHDTSIRMILRENERHALQAYINQNPDKYASKSEFIREAMIEKLKTVGIIPVSESRPRVIRSNPSHTLKMISSTIVPKLYDWMSTPDICKEFEGALTNKQVYWALQRLQSMNILKSELRYDPIGANKMKIKIFYWKKTRNRHLTQRHYDMIRQISNSGNCMEITKSNKNMINSLAKRGIVERENGKAILKVIYINLADYM